MSIKEHPPQRGVETDDSSDRPRHVPVLLEASLRLLHPLKGETYLDLTAGYGGHAARFFATTENYTDSVLVDQDEFAISQLAEFSQKGVQLVQSDFVSAARQLIQNNRTFDIVLADLGVSSPQLDRADRGFSFTNSGPLDMRMNQTSDFTAETLVNTATKKELIRIITSYGEEPLGFARRIATAIIATRPLHTTKELADLILEQHHGRWQKTHPATRTFQALRIAVNDELGQIETMLPLLPQLLKPGGRVGVISFHSLEDRLVKRYFNKQRDDGLEAELEVLTKKPLSGATDDVHNPRSRSAKLRAAVKK